MEDIETSGQLNEHVMYITSGNQSGKIVLTTFNRNRFILEMMNQYEINKVY